MTQKYRLKNKKGYEYRKGISGKERWHKINPAGEVAERRDSDAPRPRRGSLEILGGTGQGGGLSQNVLSSRGLRINRQIKGRFQPSAKLDDLYEASLELSNQNRKESDQIANMYISRNAGPMVTAAFRDPSWNIENTYHTGGIGSQLGTGLNTALLHYHNVSEEISSKSSPFDRFATILNDADMSITPTLPSAHDLIQEQRDKNTSVYQQYEADLEGNGLVNNSAHDAKDRRRIIATKIIDHLIEKKIKSRSPEYRAITTNTPLKSVDDLPEMSHISHLTSLSAGMSELTGRTVDGGEDKLIKALADRLEGGGYQLDMSQFMYSSSGMAGANGPEYYSQIEEVARKLGNFRAATHPKSKKMLNKLENNMMDTRIKKAGEEAATARLLTNSIASNFIDSLGIREIGGKETGDSKILADTLLRAVNSSTEFEISSDLSDFKQAVSPRMIVGSREYLGNYFNLAGGLVKTEANPQIAERVSLDVMPGYSSVALHEAMHGLDIFISSASVAAGYGDDSTLLEWFDNNMKSKSNIQPIKNAPGAIDARTIESPAKMARHDLQISKPENAKRKSALRNQITRDLIHISKAMAQRNQNERDFIENNSINLPKGEARKMVHSLSDNIISPLNTIPEFNRIMYAVSANRNPNNFLDRAGLHNDFNTVSDDIAGFKMAATNNPEIVTVLIECALGAPHILQAMDEYYGTSIRKNLNRYLGVSIVQKSRPDLLMNARINLIAAAENPDSLYQQYIDKTIKDVHSHDMTPYQSKLIAPRLPKPKYRSKSSKIDTRIVD